MDYVRAVVYHHGLSRPVHDVEITIALVGCRLSACRCLALRVSASADDLKCHEERMRTLQRPMWRKPPPQPMNKVWCGHARRGTFVLLALVRPCALVVVRDCVDSGFLSPAGFR